MPAKRSSAKKRDHPITPEAVDAYRRGDRTYLQRTLSLRPWQPSPLGAAGACPWLVGSSGARDWPLAIALRAELEAATCL